MTARGPWLSAPGRQVHIRRHALRPWIRLLGFGAGGIVTMRASVHNQHGDLVLDGVHKYLLRLGVKA